eukprot:9995010-Alexandrium_andersonii.AAC.1
MSASLVGSEMCIRDSLGGSPARAGCSGAASSLCSRCAVAGRRGRPAVSYTHLTLPTICSV